MSRSASPLMVFQRTGDRSGIDAEAGERRPLRPALFGAYRDLSRLRFDFPLVLNADRGREPWILSLTDVFDRIIREICAPGAAGDQTRRQLLAQEQAIRNLLAQGKRGALGRLWKLARRDLDGSRKKALKQLLQRAQSMLPLDGAVWSCDHDFATKMIGRAWEESETRKARTFYRRIARLIQKLRDILEVDDRRSAKAFAAERLESSIGSADRNVFDFAVMSKLLGKVCKGDRLPLARRQRIEATIRVLESQRFVADERANGEVYEFRFGSCRAALAAYRARLPKMALLVRAIGIAELEVENRYDETMHDQFFAAFEPGLLGPADFGLFPSYLLCLSRRGAELGPEVIRLLAAGLPFKIVAQFGEVFGAEDLADGGLAFGTRAQQGARMAIGLNHAFVLQASNSSLYRLRDAVMRGVGGERPALFSIFAGSSYLDGAAATESRAFPCLVYDPDAGPTQADRFCLAGNPAPAQDWTRHVLRCEGPDHEPRTHDTSFSLVDFIAADDRFRAHFAVVAEDDWDDDMLPCAEFLQVPPEQRARQLPYVLLLDAENRLLRAVVDEKVIDAALRCRDAWRGLGELAGIDNSHANAAVEAARRAWDAERADLSARAALAAKAEIAPPREDSAGGGDTAQPEPEARAEETAPEPATDDPWIETLRCTSCNECTLINDRMFAYDDDLRAYLADPDAGTYRELVEAAESCQVAIIHPGKPRNPDEPGLDELVERARPFL